MRKSIDELLLNISDKRKEISAFCGAGISIHSGIPAAIPFLNKLLKKLDLDDIDATEFIDSSNILSMPFEAFVEVFLDNINDNSLLDIFKLGEPNVNHMFLKKMVELNRMTEIYTTNFDLLIENVFKQPKEIPIIVYKNETDYIQIENSKTNDINLIKVHGSIDDINSIRTTITTITNKHLSHAREKIIERAFGSEGKSDIVLILGYSCSDIFDIIPWIEKIHKSNKEIIYVEHHPEVIQKSDVLIEPLSVQVVHNPFKTYKGFRLKVNTDFFIEWLWNMLVADYPGRSNSIDLSDDVIKKWIASFHSQYLKYTIIGQLFYKLKNFDKALKYHLKALESNNGRNKRGQGASLNNIGLILHGKEEYDKALEYFNLAKDVFQEIQFEYGIAAAFTNIGFTYIFKGERYEAHKSLMQSLSISRGKNFKECRICEADALNCLGLLYYKFGEYDTSLHYYFATLEIDEDGNKAGEAVTLSDIGKVYLAKKEYHLALVYYKKALEITTKLGNREDSTAYQNIIAELNEKLG